MFNGATHLSHPFDVCGLHDDELHGDWHDELHDEASFYISDKDKKIQTEFNKK
jgi:hypothetical protein